MKQTIDQLVEERNQLSNSINLCRQASGPLRPIRICNCPCNKQIEQNERLIELQNQYVKTLQLQNLRRNEERISLQTEIKQLRLQLQQPRKQKAQLRQQIIHLKQKLKKQTSILKQKEQKLQKTLAQLDINEQKTFQLRTINEKLQNTLKLEQQQSGKLKKKMNQMYQKMNSAIRNERRSTTMSGLGGGSRKKSQTFEQIISRIENKWEQYGNQLQNKFNSDKLKLQQKHQIEIDRYRKLLLEAEQKYEEKTKDIEGLSEIVKKSKKTDQEVKKLTQTIEQRQKQNKLLVQAKKKLKQQNESSKILIKQQKAQIQQLINHKNLSLVQETIDSNPSVQVQTQNLITHADKFQQQKTLKLAETQRQLSLTKENLQAKQKELERLAHKIQTLQKIADLFKKKEQELVQHRKEHLNRNLQSDKKMHSSTIIDEAKTTDFSKDEKDSTYFSLKSIIESKKPLEKGQQLNVLLLGSILQRHILQTQRIKSSIQEMQQLIKQKDNQIGCLQEANSHLKKLKLQSLENATKIQDLQRENFQLRKVMGIGRSEKININKFSKSQINQCSNFRNSGVLGSSNQKSQIVSKNYINRHERSYLTCFSNHKKSQAGKSSDSQAPQSFLLDILNANTNQKQAKIKISPFISQVSETNNLSKLKMNRNDTFQSDPKNCKKKVNFMELSHDRQDNMDSTRNQDNE